MSIFRVFGKKYDHYWKFWKIFGKIKKNYKEGKMSLLADKSGGKSMTVWGALVGSLGLLLTGLADNMADGSLPMNEIIETLGAYVGPVAKAIGGLFVLIGGRKVVGKIAANGKK